VNSAGDCDGGTYGRKAGCGETVVAIVSGY
jgi:hypothetical protein